MAKEKKFGIPPPDFDRFRIDIALPPVSQQASKLSRDRFKQQIQSQCRDTTFLFSGDVKMEVEWYIHEQERYETDRSPDVDNILKPLLDALSGPDGILIDDNQVQSICCSWLDWVKGDEYISVSFKFSPDEWLPRGNFEFVQFDQGLCYPIPTSLPLNSQLIIIQVFEQGLKSRREAEQQGIGYESSRGLMPSARLFHRTRIHGFPVVSLSEFKESRNDS